jgi:hypothetical protein
MLLVFFCYSAVVAVVLLLQKQNSFLLFCYSASPETEFLFSKNPRFLSPAVLIYAPISGTAPACLPTKAGSGTGLGIF